jgi:O-antigen biosynthesis protein
MIKKLIPPAVKKAYRKLFPAWKGVAFQCPVCSTGLAYYNPFPQEYYDNWKAYGFELGDKQETLFVRHYQCPKCRCADRDRFAALVTKQWLIDKKEVRMMEFAPLECTANFFSSQPQVNVYESADIASPLAKHRVDICDLSTFPDGSFDLIYCSHVLEHVTDDSQAMRELYRILAPGGMAMLYVPVFDIPVTVEDKNELMEEERWRRFGQNDHVRIYNSDGFAERLSAAGFEVEKRRADSLPADVLERAGVEAKSVIYLGFKRKP